jgi:phosphohistidine phosphatase SixA
MNNETNNHVDNMVNNVIVDEVLSTDIIEVDIDAIHTDIETIETDADKVGKGRPPHLPNADTRIKVYTLSTVGTRHEDIASVLNISHDTLVKYYKEELDKGRIEANASVAETLFKQAKEGNTTAMIFWLKSRAKWKESTQHEISGNPDGSPVEVKIITGIE